MQRPQAHGASVLHMMHALLRNGGVARAVGRGSFFRAAAMTEAEAAGGGAAEEGEVGMMETLAFLLAAAVHDFEVRRGNSMCGGAEISIGFPSDRRATAF